VTCDPIPLLDGPQDVATLRNILNVLILQINALWECLDNAFGNADHACVIDGGGSAITTGIKLDIGPYDYDLNWGAVTLIADQSGSIQLDFVTQPYSSYTPGGGSSIVASAPPKIVSDVKSRDITLTGWTKSFPAGTVMTISVTSAATIQRVEIVLQYDRPI
jgi:hypothetical protein